MRRSPRSAFLSIYVLAGMCLTSMISENSFGGISAAQTTTTTNAVLQCFPGITSTSLLPSELDEEHATCVCNALKGLRQNHNDIPTELATYCIAFSSADKTVPLEITLMAVDTAAAVACAHACANPADPYAQMSCNCGGLIEGAVSLSQQAILFKESKDMRINDGPMAIFMGPVLGSLGVGMDGPTACQMEY